MQKGVALKTTATSWVKKAIKSTAKAHQKIQVATQIAIPIELSQFGRQFGNIGDRIPPCAYIGIKIKQG